MRRRAERKGVTIEFQASRGFVGKPEIADDLAPDALEHSSGAAVPAVGHAT